MLVLRDNLVPKFKDVLSEGEKIVWISAPNFNAYIFSSVLLFLVAMIYGVSSAFEPFFNEIANINIDFSLINNELRESKIDWNIILSEITNTPFHLAVVIKMMPIFFCIWNLFSKIKSHSQTYYAKTNKRLIFRGGIRGNTYESIYEGKVTKSIVKVSFFDVIFRTGSITFNTDQRDSGGNIIAAGKMISIPNPHAAYQEIHYF